MMTPGDLPIYDQTDHGIKLIEEERRRIARDLHDGPAQAITNLSMRLDIVRRMIERQPDLAAVELERLYQRVRVAVSDVRRLIYDLRPIAIDETGLVESIAQLGERNQEDWGIPIHLIVDEHIKLNIAPARQVAIYRLIQEVLTNVHKHAQATQIEIQLTELADGLKIQIADDGKGFDLTHIPPGHYGIVGLRERAEYLGGRVNIDSSPGSGTCVQITIPSSFATPSDFATNVSSSLSSEIQAKADV